MIKKIIFLRHAMTEGNLEKRYVGSTDEGILGSEKKFLEAFSDEKYIEALLISSPMRRCLETCFYLTGREPDFICDGFREMNFGEFEYKNFTELDGNPDYQAFINSNGEKAFPNGESKQEFTERTCQAFSDLMRTLKNDERPLAFFVHGGTIMALLSGFGIPKQDYFSYQTKPLSGFKCTLTDEPIGSDYIGHGVVGIHADNADEKYVQVDYDIQITDITSFSLRH